MRSSTLFLNLRRSTRYASWLGAAATLATLGACSHISLDFLPPTAQASATLAPTKGNTASGSLSFEQHGAHVLVTGTVLGLKPGQEHGFHIHEKGDCSSGDGLGTGGHFNPSAAPHGPQHAAHHAGDMPALKADANGQAQLSFRLEGVSLTPGASSIAGRGLIVHAGPDDYQTQPTGNSGARIACGVIQLR